MSGAWAIHPLTPGAGGHTSSPGPQMVCSPGRGFGGPGPQPSLGTAPRSRGTEIARAPPTLPSPGTWPSPRERPPAQQGSESGEGSPGPSLDAARRPETPGPVPMAAGGSGGLRRPPAGQSAEPRFLPLCGRARPRPSERDTIGGRVAVTPR